MTREEPLWCEPQGSATARRGYSELRSADHLSEALVPDDDLTAEGDVHAECASAADSKACLCGFSAIDPAGLDTHLLTAFTSGDGLGRDGRAHGGCEPAAAGPRA